MNIFTKLYLLYWKLPRRIRFYKKMLGSDRYSTIEDYEYFARKIHQLRSARKELLG